MPRKPATPDPSEVASASKPAPKKRVSSKAKPPAKAAPKAVPKAATKAAPKTAAKVPPKAPATAKPATKPATSTKARAKPAAKAKTAPAKPLATAKAKKPAGKAASAKAAKDWPTDGKGKRLELDAEEEAVRMGRPSLYLDEYALVAKIVCGIAGLDEEKLGAELGVTGRTVRNWMKKHPAFAEAVSRGRDRADNDVVNAAFKTATGFMMPAVDIRTVGVGKGLSVVEITHYDKYVPGDSFAQQYWLNNRRPDQWKAKVEVAIEATVMDVATAEAKFWERMHKSKERHADMVTERNKHGLSGD